MRATEIRIGAGVRRELQPFVDRLGADRPVVALVDENVAAAHAGLVPDSWRHIPLAGGEGCKSFATLERVVRALARWELDRRTVLVAIGGGAVGDLGGLTASLYLRGIELVQMPTTLLAMLDSSVGGKTAINIPEGKNLVGSFCPPAAMFADLDLVRSLPAEHLRSGLGEALKMGIGFSLPLFELLEREADAILTADPELLTEVVRLAVDAKMDCVRDDPKETTGRRRCLNLGHTLAHALEAMSGYQMLHGHAVAHGLHYALELAVALEVMGAGDAARCHALVERYGFVRQPAPDHRELLPYFLRDKKMDAGRLFVVLPTEVGNCVGYPVDPRTMQPAAG